MRLYTLVCLFAVLCLPGQTKGISINEMRDCQIAGASKLRFTKAKCTELEVAEDPQQKNANKITLKIALIPALVKNSGTNPLVFISGGPGSSAIESYVDSMMDGFRYIHEKHDILLIDQRGTGGSSALDCASDENLYFSEADISLEKIREYAKQCLDSLNYDPRFFTTSVAVRDIEHIRQAFAYRQLNIYGSSYGSRVALHYLKRYPQYTRSVILDGVVPPGLALGPGIPIDAQNALELMFKRCGDSPQCHMAFQNLAQHFHDIHQILKKAPIPINMLDPVSAEPVKTQITEYEFTMTVRLMSYSPRSLSILPVIIERAHKTADYSALKALSQTIFREMSNSLSDGMANAVVCTEDVPFFKETQIDRDKIAATYLGNRQLDVLGEVCSVWPTGIIDEDFHLPLQSSVPVLILSGSADPVTPAANGEKVLETLSNALHIVGEGMGHGIFAAGCMPKLMSEFVSSASVADLDSSCLKIQLPDPFFINAVGPGP